MYSTYGLSRMDVDTTRCWLPVWADAFWRSASARVAKDFVSAYSDPACGAFWPPRPPLPGADSTAGELVLPQSLAYGSFVAFTVPARSTYVRARAEDDPLVAWAAARAGSGVGILSTLGLLAYTLPPAANDVTLLRRVVTRVRRFRRVRLPSNEPRAGWRPREPGARRWAARPSCRARRERDHVRPVQHQRRPLPEHHAGRGGGAQQIGRSVAAPGRSISATPVPDLAATRARASPQYRIRDRPLAGAVGWESKRVRSRTPRVPGPSHAHRIRGNVGRGATYQSRSWRSSASSSSRLASCAYLAANARSIPAARGHRGATAAASAS